MGVPDRVLHARLTFALRPTFAVQRGVALCLPNCFCMALYRCPSTEFSLLRPIFPTLILESLKSSSHITLYFRHGYSGLVIDYAAGAFLGVSRCRPIFPPLPMLRNERVGVLEIFELASCWVTQVPPHVIGILFEVFLCYIYIFRRLVLWDYENFVWRPQIFSARKFLCSEFGRCCFDEAAAYVGGKRLVASWRKGAGITLVARCCNTQWLSD